MGVTPREAREKIRDDDYLSELLRRMKRDPIGRANVEPQVVTALIVALKVARESNRINFELAKRVTG